MSTATATRRTRATSASKSTPAPAPAVESIIPPLPAPAPSFVTLIASSAVSMENVGKLAVDDALSLAKLCDDTQRSAYLTIAKVMVSLRDHKFDGGVPLATKLREAGIRKTTIDNARRVHNAYLNLVVDGFLTEAQFDDAMGYTESVVLAKVLDSKCKKPLTAGESAKFILANPETFVDEFESFALYGLSVADKVAFDAKPKGATAATTTPAVVTTAKPAAATPPVAAAPAASTTATATPAADAAPTPAPAADESRVIVPLPPQTTATAHPVKLSEGASKLAAAFHDLIGECEDVAQLRVIAAALTSLASTASEKADEVEIEAIDAAQGATVG